MKHGMVQTKISENQQGGGLHQSEQLRHPIYCKSYEELHLIGSILYFDRN